MNAYLACIKFFKKVWHNILHQNLHGAQIKNAKWIKVCQNFIILTIETCNTSMERKFCEVLANNFNDCENSSYEAQFAISWQMAELWKSANYEV